MFIAVFVLIALSILYLTHYFLYLSIVHFFGVAGLSRKLVPALALFILATSFIASEILLRASASFLSQALYFISSLWLGVGLTLATCFVLAWLGWGAARVFTNSPAPALFGWTAVALAGLYSGYGVWNAYHPRTTEISVSIKNLPSEWRGKSIVQLSDVHLGHILGPTFLKGIVEMVNARNPEIVLITGDLFDGSDGRLDELVRPLNDIRAPLGIYYVTGNHETYLGVARAYEALKTTRVRILEDEMTLIYGLQLIGISYPQRGVGKNLAEAISKLPGFDSEKPSILLYHNPDKAEQAIAAGVNLMLAGHTHKGQIFPIQFISRLIYKKYYNGLHVEGDTTIYTSSGAGTWGPTMRTGNHPEIAVIRLN